MPNGDGTGPDGKGPKRKDKGFPQRYRNGQCRRQGQRQCNKEEEKEV